MKLIVDIFENGLGDSAYEVLEECDKITLKYSQIGNWTKKGAKASSLENTGNGWVFKDINGGNKFKIDYSQMSELMMLLKLHNETFESVILRKDS